MKKNKEIILEITDLAFGGKGIGRVSNLVGMVQGALPGQTVKVKVSKVKRRYFEAKILELLKKGNFETDQPWQNTPGAPWIRLPPKIQREYKKKQVFKS